MASVPSAAGSEPARVSVLYDPKVRSIAYQLLLIGALVFLVYEAASNAVENLRAARIASGFGFLDVTAGFDINQQLIPFSGATSTYGRAFFVGLINTLLVGVIGIVFATVIGFLVGIARLSNNWIIAQLAKWYVEIIRNLPLLLQLVFWYNAVLKPLPEPRNSIDVGGVFFLNNRGLYVPEPVLGATGSLLFGIILAGIVGTLAFRRWARVQQAATGRQYPVGLVALGLIVGLPALFWLVTSLAGSPPMTFNFAEKGRFNLTGGLQVFPEFVALTFGLSLYTAAFIAEIVRAGILAVSKGQTEAANALGLRGGPTLRLVVIPQAMRVIVPPLTSQYLNLVKNSSLAVAIGYPDLVQIFMGTVLNQTGQAVEVIGITMAVYLTISLVTSLLMNIYNRRVAIVER